MKSPNGPETAVGRKKMAKHGHRHAIAVLEDDQLLGKQTVRTVLQTAGRAPASDMAEAFGEFVNDVPTDALRHQRDARRERGHYDQYDHKKIA